MANSRGDWVDFTENRFQGTYLGWFIRTQLNSIDNEAYLVLPIPSAITPF